MSQYTCEACNLAQNSSAPRSQEDYITQVSEEIEGRVTKRLPKEFSRTENRILGALARLDDFRMNPILPGRSGTTPEPSRNALNTSHGTNEDDSQNDPRPEAGLFHGQMTKKAQKIMAQKMATTLNVDVKKLSIYLAERFIIYGLLFSIFFSKNMCYYTRKLFFCRSSQKIRRKLSY